MRFVIPAKKQPKVFDAIKRGYATLSNHIYLLLFPIGLDLFFLFGERLLITNQVQAMIDGIIFPPGTGAEMLQSWEELSAGLLELLKNFSLTAFLRSFPVGIPSLLAFRPMEVSPLGDFATVQVQSLGGSMLYILGFSLIGFLLGALFFLLIRNTVHGNDLSIPRKFPNQLLSLVAIPIVIFLFTFFIISPILLLISVFNSILPFLGTIGYFFLSLGLISLGIPLFFTAHEILLSGSSFVAAARKSIETVRPTNGKTSIFLMLAFLGTYATNFLWQIPHDGSWMLIVSILGHALVTTIFLIASFHFYIDAQNCVRESLLTTTPVNEEMGV
ncbi:MAG: hypothetical protein PHW11_05210 [Anaerolineaceae bacterium]|jgi:hypothetical protein|nr:hypothetical protein [Anaerolineaceae bacterium]MDD4042045.1 hypothetical protein [Anaerolineaceae bacterium]MDD4578549.1 hypothetical protein [Anaerolineaceae bacterium]